MVGGARSGCLLGRRVAGGGPAVPFYHLGGFLWGELGERGGGGTRFLSEPAEGRIAKKWSGRVGRGRESCRAKRGWAEKPKNNGFLNFWGLNPLERSSVGRRPSSASHFGDRQISKILHFRCSENRDCFTLTHQTLTECSYDAPTCFPGRKRVENISLASRSPTQGAPGRLGILRESTPEDGTGWSLA